MALQAELCCVVAASTAIKEVMHPKDIHRRVHEAVKMDTWLQYTKWKMRHWEMSVEDSSTCTVSGMENRFASCIVRAWQTLLFFQQGLTRSRDPVHIAGSIASVHLMAAGLALLRGLHSWKSI